ncbi:isopentenyl-diphosphate Delta-isomerase [Solicola sp. PLA-1-18]|uniref:isopentenyl-diphosphate Delta-isomerase n=1 Tax=Solicola sp. PLA-1-18 TaxID=3380532 RepID=UPI003B7B4C06
MSAEQVVLLDESGAAVGTTPKAGVHHLDTPLHLAFSCYVFAGDRLLLTRRAASKTTWPATWTNTVCGHPGPGERLEDAVRRRAVDELGLEVDDVRLVLPGFRYRAVMDDGVVENEICPVLVATTSADPVAAPDEVDDWTWVEWDELVAGVLTGERAVSPWCIEQVTALFALGGSPAEWQTAPDAALPPGARPENHPAVVGEP